MIEYVTELRHQRDILLSTEVNLGGKPVIVLSDTRSSAAD